MANASPEEWWVNLLTRQDNSLAIQELRFYISRMKKIFRQLNNRVQSYLNYFPVTAILGPRQCGKTTLAKSILAEFSERKVLYLDLERPSDLAKLSDAEAFLQRNRNCLICLDEIQRSPELFPLLRSLCDTGGEPARFLLLGSASPELLKQSSESLAGRIGYLELTPFTESEVGQKNQETLWLRGGFPRSFGAPEEALSCAWRDNFIQTFLERDIPQLGITIPSVNLRHFWQMCAHLQGDLWNHAKVAASLGVTGKTVAHYLDILEKAYMVRRLQPFAANVKKRLVKTPRVYLRDSGLVHRLLRIDDMDMLSGHPIRGASWEGYVIEQIASAVPDAELSFYRTSAGAEIDLLVKQGERLTAIEIKASVAPRVERGFWNALEDVKPDAAWVIGSVTETYPIGKNVTAAPVQTVCQQLS